jgi:TM2 domain-containing membrane protein YozV
MKNSKKEVNMFSDEEKNKIIEEEKIRLKIRLKYEQKSSGLAGVLSSICPGLGQIYNGQFGKASSIGISIIISLVLLSLGITFWIKGVPQKGEKVSATEEKTIEMTDEGVILEEVEKEKSKGKKEEKKETKAKSPYVLTILGVLGLACTWSYAVKDAIKTANRLNEEAIKEL